MNGWQVLGIVVGVIASFFTAIMATLPFFFAHLKVVMSNTVLQERKELNTLFVSRIEYDTRHASLQALLQESLEASKQNGAMLEEIIRTTITQHKNK